MFHQNRFLFASFLSVALVSTLSISAQTSKELTIETLFGGGLSSPSPSQVRWTPDGRMSYFLTAKEGGRDLWVLDPATGKKDLIADAETLRRMAPSPSQATNQERERTRRTRFGVPAYRWSPDGDRILFASAGRIYLYQVASRKADLLAPSKTSVLDPKFSPDGKWIAFVYKHDIWIVSASGDGVERQVTFGGHDLLLHGDLDWIYPEELGVRTGYDWSPDSQRIAFLEMDESPVPTYPITDQVARQATADFQRYPKAGDPNPKVRVGIAGLHGGRAVWIDRAAEYIPRMQWKDSETLAIQLLNRNQNELELIAVDPESGRSRSIFIEKDPYWVDVTRDLHFLHQGKEFIWTSQRSGLRHIYLYSQEGKLLRQLTRGEYQVTAVEGLDEKNDWVYFSSNENNPIGSDLYRVKLDGSVKERVTKRKGTHRIGLDPTATIYRDRFSSMNDVGETTIHHLPTGRSMPFSRPHSLKEFNLIPPEMKMLKTPDGASVRLLLYKPRRLEPGKKYPVLVYVYGMAGFPTIRDAWGGNRGLFHRFLVQNGYVVAQIDDRSSAIWGHKYSALAFHDVGPLAARDHGFAVDYLKSLPYVDGERMAIWGWSGGGFTTSYHMTHTGIFKVGIAGAPVTDWHLYDSIYTERYMGLPQDDPEAYEKTSAVKAAKDLSGRILLIFGTQDDNVHPQNSIQLINGLIQSRKQFSLMLYPNKTHGITGRNENVHLYTMIYEYLERYLIN